MKTFLGAGRRPRGPSRSSRPRLRYRWCGYYDFFFKIYYVMHLYAHMCEYTSFIYSIFFPFLSLCAFDKRPPRVNNIYDDDDDDDDALQTAVAVAVINPLRDNWTN